MLDVPCCLPQSISNLPVAWIQEVKQGGEMQKHDSVPLVVNNNGMKNRGVYFILNRKISIFSKL